MKNFHVLLITYLSYTNKLPARIKITSERFEQSVIVSINEYGSGVAWLKKNKFKIIGTSVGKKCIYAVSTTFEPLKKSKNEKSN